MLIFWLFFFSSKSLDFCKYRKNAFFQNLKFLENSWNLPKISFLGFWRKGLDWPSPNGGNTLCSIKTAQKVVKNPNFRVFYHFSKKPKKWSNWPQFWSWGALGLTGAWDHGIEGPDQNSHFGTPERQPSKGPARSPRGQNGHFQKSKNVKFSKKKW